jgi:hypothetical protein
LQGKPVDIRIPVYKALYQAFCPFILRRKEIESEKGQETENTKNN